MTSPRQRITVTVQSLLYHSEQTGYSVAKGQSARDKDNVIFVGTFPVIGVGERYELEGEFLLDPRYGMRFVVNTAQLVPPSTVEQMRAYLCSGAVKGIGPTTAERLVAAFGDKTFAILDDTPHRLSEVPGIGTKRREQIATSWEQHRGVRPLIIAFQGYGLRPSLAVKLYKKYRSQTLPLLRENPYRLVGEVYGVGFATIDSIGKAMGFTPTDPLRIQAGLWATIKQHSLQGHSIMTREACVINSATLLGIENDDIRSQIEQICLTGQVIAVDADFLAMRELWLHESFIASEIARRCDVSPPPLGMFKEHALGNTKNGDLSDEQHAAISHIAASAITIVTGGPGTGKTTLIKAIVQAYQGQNDLVLAAPTGRAARRMEEATGYPAKTLHRLLEYLPHEGRYGRDQQRPLEGTCFVIDEASMLDIPLCSGLLNALPEGARLVLVGDIDQLPSVGPGNVLRDLIEAGLVPTTRLHAIFRQAQSSLIIQAAHLVNGGKSPPSEVDPNTSDFFWIAQRDEGRMLAVLERLVTNRIPQRLHEKASASIQILAPMNKGSLGIIQLNAFLRELLNPKLPGKAELEGFRQGDKVMQLRNNYDKDVFNGDIGYIEAIDAESNALTVRYGGNGNGNGILIVRYTYDELDELGLAYATTIHKSQGSEHDAVVIILHYQHQMMLRRNLLYTAITRGKRLVVLIAPPNVVERCVREQEASTRQTALKDLLVRYVERME